jgi:diguanylate cyclase (GGDEF)-like protein/PAS domain S-box-containing protein
MTNEAMYLEVINNLCDGVYYVDMERRITFWNSAAEKISGYTSEEIVGRFCHENLLSHIDKDGKALCLLGCPLYATLIDGKQRNHEVFLRHKAGHRLPVLVNIFPMKEKDEITGAIEIFTRNSPIVYDDHLIEDLSNLAMHDPLTGLSNRRKTENYLEFKFTELKRFHHKFCVTFLDIDNFSKFNNTCGHDVGDEVLKLVSKSMSRAARRSDLIGRWGGEEFICVSEIREDFETLIIAEKIRMLIANSLLEHNGEQLSVTASLGTTIARDNDTVESIVHRADELMYKSKVKGKNCITSDT